MDIGKAIYKLLSEYVGLSALVGTKIYPGSAPYGMVSPYITYFCIHSGNIHTQGNDPNFYMPLFQVSSWADSYTSVSAVDAQVTARLRDYSGAVTIAEETVTIQIVIDDGAIDLTEINPDTHKIWYHRAHEFRIVYVT